MEKVPLSAQPREGAKSLVRFLITQNNLEQIADGEGGLIHSAPFDVMQESLGNKPSLATVVGLLEVALKTIGGHSTSFDQYQMERIGRMVEYIVTELSNKVTVYEYHPEHTIQWPLPKDFHIEVKKPASEEQLTGKPLARLIATELRGKLDTIVQDPKSRFARELVRRLNQLVKS